VWPDRVLTGARAFRRSQIWSDGSRSSSDAVMSWVLEKGFHATAVVCFATGDVSVIASSAVFFVLRSLKFQMTVLPLDDVAARMYHSSGFHARLVMSDSLELLARYCSFWVSSLRSHKKISPSDEPINSSRLFNGNFFFLFMSFTTRGKEVVLQRVKIERFDGAVVLVLELDLSLGVALCINRGIERDSRLRVRHTNQLVCLEQLDHTVVQCCRDDPQWQLIGGNAFKRNAGPCQVQQQKKNAPFAPHASWWNGAAVGTETTLLTRPLSPPSLLL